MKKVFALIMVCTLVVLLAACGGTPATSAPSGTGAPASQAAPAGGDAGDVRTIKVAWCDDTMDQTRAIMKEAVEARIEAINSERSDIKLELTYYDAQKSVDKQLADVETALLAEPDVFIFSCVDTVGSIPAVEMIHAQGIPIVDVRDMGLDIIDCVFYGSDEETYAKTTADWLRKKLEADPDLVLKAGLIYGAAAQTQQFARCDLVKDLAEEMPDRVIVLDEKYGDWDTEKSMNITEDWMQSQPEMNYICCANDIMALGASNALVAAQKKADVMVSGYDLTDEGITLIAEGKQDVSVGARLQDYGLMLDVALGLAEGTYTESTYYVKEVYAVDSTNVQEYLDGTIQPYWS